MLCFLRVYLFVGYLVFEEKNEFFLGEVSFFFVVDGGGFSRI